MGEDEPEFDFYPDAPGWRDPDTSRRAAEEFKEEASTLRGAVLMLLKVRACTVHEAAAVLRRRVPSIQPRFSELLARKRIYDTGVRRLNTVSGKVAKVWAACERPE